MIFVYGSICVKIDIAYGGEIGSTGEADYVLQAEESDRVKTGKHVNAKPNTYAMAA